MPNLMDTSDYLKIYKTKTADHVRDSEIPQCSAVQIISIKKSNTLPKRQFPYPLTRSRKYGITNRRSHRWQSWLTQS
jgi:hypothetical protein